jgi:hypothetical protein
MSKQSYTEKYQIRKTAQVNVVAKKVTPRRTPISERNSKQLDANDNVTQFISLDSIGDTVPRPNIAKNSLHITDNANNGPYQSNTVNGSSNSQRDRDRDYSYDNNEEDDVSDSGLTDSYDDYAVNREEFNNFSTPEAKPNMKGGKNTSSIQPTSSSTSSSSSEPTDNKTPSKRFPPPLPVDFNKPSPSQVNNNKHPSNRNVIYDPALPSVNEQIDRLEREIGLKEFQYNYTKDYNDNNILPNNTSISDKDKEEVKKMKYKPYTLEQYKLIQPKEYVEIVPKLRPGNY